MEDCLPLHTVERLGFISVECDYSLSFVDDEMVVNETSIICLLKIVVERELCELLNRCFSLIREVDRFFSLFCLTCSLIFQK